MENFDWPLLLKDYKGLYFTLPLMICLSIIVLLKALALRQKNRLTIIIACYAAVSLLQSLVSHIGYFKSINLNSYHFFIHYAISIFILAEITFCYWLSSLGGTSPLQRRAMRLLLLGYYLFAAIYLGITFFKKRVNDVESLVELPLLIVFCCIYFYNVFANKPQAQLARQPLFWAMGGMVLLAFMQIPYNIVYAYMDSLKKGLQVPLTINCASYCLLFICFWQALLLTQQNNNNV
jgi:hypothetical protein